MTPVEPVGRASGPCVQPQRLTRQGLEGDLRLAADHGPEAAVGTDQRGPVPQSFVVGAGDLLHLPEHGAGLHMAETVEVIGAEAYLRSERTVGEKRTGHGIPPGGT